MTAAIAPGVGPRAGRGKGKAEEGAENGEGLQNKRGTSSLCFANQIAIRL